MGSAATVGGGWCISGFGAWSLFVAQRSSRCMNTNYYVTRRLLLEQLVDTLVNVSVYRALCVDAGTVLGIKMRCMSSQHLATCSTVSCSPHPRCTYSTLCVLLSLVRHSRTYLNHLVCKLGCSEVDHKVGKDHLWIDAGNDTHACLVARNRLTNQATHAIVTTIGQ